MKSFILLPFALVLLACGGSGAVGEPCDTRGATDECADGSICDAPGDDDDADPVCLTICKDQEDCGADESCNGVSGSSTKACHPKDDDDVDLDGDGDGKDK